jgi:hypothetical protein
MADMLRIQNEAKDRGFDSAEFFIAAPKGIFEAKWLDAYFGFFNIPAVGEGFVTEKQLPPGSEGFWDRQDAEAYHEKAFGWLRQIAAVEDFE